ncbi:MAG: hypothetical protein QG608_2074, partial [Actinomycetota bacterium]|nr:hypothetical protein [Actinomycetota bacterium]
MREAADVPAARVAARVSGERVEALSERSESSTTWVNPDGSLTSELFAGPRWVRRGEEWVEVDVTLQKASDGTVVSRAHPKGLRLGGRGGARPASMKAARSAPARDLVTLGQGDDAVTLRWKGGLPEPVLSGARATYPQAVPGADVVVEATRTGFEQFVVLKERPAATDWSYTLPLVVRGVKARKASDGGVEFVDRRTGKVRAVMPAPVMWDASGEAGSGRSVRQVPAAMAVSQKGSSIELTVTPDAGFLADPATVYPVTVDPSTTGLWMVSDTFIKPNDTSGRTGATSLEWGTNPAGVTMKAAQTFMTWYTEPVADALVTDAKLSLWNYNSGNTADCKSRGWSVYPADKTAWSSVLWADRPVPVEGAYATSYETRGGAGCTADGWINADLTELVQVWASARNTNSPMMIKAGAESDTTYFKQLNSSDAATNVPKLTVTYNYRPRTGTAQEAGPPFVKDA